MLWRWGKRTRSPSALTQPPHESSSSAGGPRRENSGCSAKKAEICSVVSGGPERADHVGQLAAGGDLGGHGVEQLGLPPDHRARILLGQPPLGLRVTAQHAQPRARGVEQHQIEEPRGLLLDQVHGGGGDTGDAGAAGAGQKRVHLGGLQIHGHDLGLVGESRGHVQGLAAGAGTGVEDAGPRTRVHVEHDQLGALVLHQIPPLPVQILPDGVGQPLHLHADGRETAGDHRGVGEVLPQSGDQPIPVAAQHVGAQDGAGPLVERLEERAGFIRSHRVHGRLHHPGRKRVHRPQPGEGIVGGGERRLALMGELAQHGVDEARGRGPHVQAGQLHGPVHGDRGRDVLHEQDLVRPDQQLAADEGVAVVQRRGRVLRHRALQARAMTQHAEEELLAQGAHLPREVAAHRHRVEGDGGVRVVPLHPGKHFLCQQAGFVG